MQVVRWIVFDVFSEYLIITFNFFFFYFCLIVFTLISERHIDKDKKNNEISYKLKKIVHFYYYFFLMYLIDKSQQMYSKTAFLGCKIVDNQNLK